MDKMDKFMIGIVLFVIVVNILIGAAITAVVAFFTTWPTWVCVVIGVLGAGVLSNIL